MPRTEVLDLYELRFKFLFPHELRGRLPRYRLHAPDMLQPKWEVWDSEEKRTVARGVSPELAVDQLIPELKGRLP